MTLFLLLRDYNIRPKKELHSSPWVCTIWLPMFLILRPKAGVRPPLYGDTTMNQFLSLVSEVDAWTFPKLRGPLSGSPHNKDHNILGSILRT